MIRILIILLLSVPAIASTEFLRGSILVDKTPPYSQYILSQDSGEKFYLYGLYGQSSFEGEVVIPLNRALYKTNEPKQYILNPIVLPTGAEQFLDIEDDVVEFYFLERVQPKDEDINNTSFAWGHGAIRVGNKIYNFFPFGKEESYFKHILTPAEFFFTTPGYLNFRSIWSIKIKVPAKKIEGLQSLLDNEYGLNGGKIQPYDKILNNCMNALNASLGFLGFNGEPPHYRSRKKDYKFIEPFTALFTLASRFHLPYIVENYFSSQDYKYLGLSYYPQLKVEDSVFESTIGRHWNKSWAIPTLGIEDVSNPLPDLTESWKSFSSEWDMSVAIQSSEAFATDPTMKLLTCDGIIEEGHILQTHLIEFYHKPKYAKDRAFFDELHRSVLHLGEIQLPLRERLSEYLGLPLDMIGRTYPLVLYTHPEDLRPIATRAKPSYLRSLVGKPNRKLLQRLSRICRAGQLTEDLKDQFNEQCEPISVEAAGLEKLQVFIDLVLNKGIRQCKKPYDIRGLDI
ncbi:MAG: hypothetical protein CL677_06005 [Bdellovibrionaceae bacterium]|nr:hypothetical protein [Pseudobdellovibrionaceae bacterium]|tara:strand:+ start:149498 stop:151033 length:1536 start_codon:yes stop_codon:yes gene_type:complete